jgi:hypothetical protein
MFTRKADAPLVVQVPTAAQDRPSWMKVGVITALGFILGVAWPRLAGVRLGPAVPETAVATSASSAPPAESAPPGPPAGPSGSVATAAARAVVSAPVVAAAAPPGLPASAAGASSASPVSLSVGHGAVFACTSSDGEALKGNACGTLPGLDSVVMPRLRRLADCPDAASANGKLHLNVRVDFARSALSVELGRTRSVAPAEPLLACAKAALSGAGASTGNIPHENARYSVAYTITLAGAASSAARGADETPAPAAAAAAPASAPEGEATVAYEVAIVRDAPRSGKIVGRLPRGTTVRLGAAKDGWYPIKYGEGFASDGWVYRGAVGK